MPFNPLKALAIAAVLAVHAGCASTKTIPMKVQSEPLGAYVMMKVKGEEEKQSDWIYLGNTPVTTQRRIPKEYLKKDHVLVLRLMKDGYVQQTKEWRGNELEDAYKEHGQIYWNPKLVDGD